MPILHVRNVPDVLYERLQTLARDEGRSLTAEVIALLDEAVARRETQRRAEAVLARIRREAGARTLPDDWTDAVALLREDRRR